MHSSYLGRWLFTPEGIMKGCLKIQGDSVVEVCEGSPPTESTNALVLPSFINAHTHIGDSLAYPAPKGSLEEVVAPPSGYKHRILRSASRSAKIDAMREAMILMSASGTSHFVDYREEGLEGVRALSEAMVDASPRAMVLGRPLSAEATEDELDAILGSCDGIGMSAVRDWPFDLLKRISVRARAAGKVFSVHASEAVNEDIDRVLDLKPYFLVHMVKATDGDLERCADAEIPVVVCPRSNEFFGLEPDITRLKRAGLHVALGTDNGMIARPDMIEELKAAFRVCKRRGGISPLEAVNLATFGGRKVLNATAKITSEIGTKSDLSVVAVAGADPLSEMVTSASSKDVQAIIRGGKVWRPESWKT
jgi:cytosine/adenosine deaminase-related metal-dependent hydrolase